MILCDIILNFNIYSFILILILILILSLSLSLSVTHFHPHSPQFRYMEQCVDRINEEILWKQPDGDSDSPQIATKQVTSAKKPNKVPISSYNDDL